MGGYAGNRIDQNFVQQMLFGIWGAEWCGELRSTYGLHGQGAENSYWQNIVYKNINWDGMPTSIPLYGRLVAFNENASSLYYSDQPWRVNTNGSVQVMDGATIRCVKD
jgi:hypothetical protein